jgi:hypothetical protein
MLGASIGWILLASGAATAAAGFTALFFPGPLSRLAFGVESVDDATVFFIRHWGMLLFVMGGLIVYSASFPATRVAILTAAAIEKFAIVLLIFFGPLRRTTAMTAIALADGVFAILYVINLVRP